MRLLLLTALTLAQDEQQPERWPVIGTLSYQYSETKSRFADDQGHGSSEYAEFYTRPNPITQQTERVMTIRKEGIYTTAYWDFDNKKSHFVYDKYSCDTVPLDDDSKLDPLFFTNPTTSIDYHFFPIVVILENDELVTDVKPIGSFTIRNRAAWGWTATIGFDDKHQANMTVYYAKETEVDRTSVPLRVEVPLHDHSYVHEVFNFRTMPLPDALFRLPDLAPCLTSHQPLIPAMAKSFHVKMEVNDRIGWANTVPDYDVFIHYLHQWRVSTYKFATRGMDDLLGIFGDTFLWSVHDFDMELMFVMDKIQGNCSIYSMNIDNGKHDNDDVWIHGNHILQHDPNWFWHIPSPEVYWYKGNSKHREIDTDRWVYDDQNAGIVYEWEFATKKWSFTYGDEKVQKPVSLKTRKTQPEPNGHHHHVDYSIYYYSTETVDNRPEEFDISQCYFGKHHRLVNFNVSDIDATGDVIRSLYYEEFKQAWIEQLATVADVSLLRISRLYTVGLGIRPHFNLQFYMLDRYPHSAASEQRNQDEAVDVIVERADLGVLDIDMRDVLGYTSRFRLVPKSFSDTEFVDANVKFNTKTVVDGHTAGGLAGAAVGGIVVGLIMGLATVSSLFQFPVLGVQVPRLIGTTPAAVL